MANATEELRLDSADAEQTMAIGRAIGLCCTAGDVIALDGELGAGKTQFVRGLAIGLGIDPRHVSSPTFVIVQEYPKAAPGNGGAIPKAADAIGGPPEAAHSPAPNPIPADAIGGFGRSVPADGISGGGFEVLIHMDAYRLRSVEDLASVGWEGDGSAMREGAVVAIEWASLLGAALPDDRLVVRIEHEPTGRSVFLWPQGAWCARMSSVRDALGKAD